MTARRYLGVPLLLAGLAGVGCRKDDGVAEAMNGARLLTEAYRDALQGKLTSALNDEGPAAAIRVCNVEAPAIGAKVLGGQREGWMIQRTALRVRNPANAPNEWQRRGLEALQERIERGTAPAAAEWHEVEEGALRYMRAIPLGGMCTLCHGDPESIPQEVKDELARLYPEDRAVGFSEGELRGAFVVTVPLGTR